MYVREERYVEEREEEEIKEKKEKKNILELEEWFESPNKQGTVIAFGDCIVYRGYRGTEGTRKVWVEPKSSDCIVTYREINGDRGEGRMIVYVFYDGVWHELQV